MRTTATLAAVLLVVGGPAIAAPPNPPPAAKLAGHASYEIKPIEMGAPYAGQKPNEKAREKLQEHLNTQLTPILETWNQAGASSGAQTRLVIEPYVSNIKFIGGGARFWGGALAGDSFVVLKVKITEQPSGTLVAEPEFYQRAAAMSGAWTVGAQDKDMLRRVATLVANYLSSNYVEAVGGPTGYEP